MQRWSSSTHTPALHADKDAGAQPSSGRPNVRWLVASRQRAPKPTGGGGRPACIWTGGAGNQHIPVPDYAMPPLSCLVCAHPICGIYHIVVRSTTLLPSFFTCGVPAHTKSLVIVASVSIVSWALIVIHTITLKTNSPTLLDVPGSLDNYRHRRSIGTSSDTPEIQTCALRSALLHAAPTSLSISSPIPSTLVLGNYHVSPPSFGPLRYAPLGQQLHLDAYQNVPSIVDVNILWHCLPQTGRRRPAVPGQGRRTALTRTFAVLLRILAPVRPRCRRLTAPCSRLYRRCCWPPAAHDFARTCTVLRRPIQLQGPDCILCSRSCHQGRAHYSRVEDQRYRTCLISAMLHSFHISTKH